MPLYPLAQRPLGTRSDLIPIDMAHFNPSFISSPLYNEERVDFQYYYCKKEQALYADTYFGIRAMGPPDFVHGGCMTAILDEAMGILPWMLGHPVVSVNVNIDLVKMTPIHSWGVVKVTIERIDKRKILTKATVHNPAGDLLVKGDGVYVIMNNKKFGGINSPHFKNLANLISNSEKSPLFSNSPIR